MTLILVCASALAAMAVADSAHPHVVPLLLAAVPCAVATALVWSQPVWRRLALAGCAAALCAGRVSLQSSEPISDMPGTFTGSRVRVLATADAPATVSAASARLNVTVSAIALAGHDAVPSHAMRALVVGDPGPFASVASGDRLTLEGRLVANDARRVPTLLFPTLLERHAATSPPSLLVQLASLRQTAQLNIARWLPEPQASLAAGVLLGGSGRLDPAFRLDLQRSGLAHFVAIDGFKQIIVATVISALSLPLLGARLAALPTLLAIASYTVISGMHPSAVRSAVMVSLTQVAALGGRVADPLTNLLLATLGMALLEPPVLADTGLQLSFSATLGILLLWPRLRRGLRRLPRLLAEPLGLTLAVTLACLPLTLSSFGLISFVSPLAHVIAVPLLPLVLVSAALLAIASPAPALAAPIAWLAWAPASVLAAVIHAFGSLPGAALSTGRLSVPAALALALGLLCWGVWQMPELADARRAFLGWRREHAPALRPAVCALSLAAAAAALSAMRPDGELHITPLRLSRGQATFVRGPTGRTAVIVAGSADPVELADNVSARLGVWERRVDTAVALDAKAQKSLALTLARYPPDQLITQPSSLALAIGGGQAVEVTPTSAGVSVVAAAPRPARSAQTTSGARPG